MQRLLASPLDGPRDRVRRAIVVAHPYVAAAGLPAGIEAVLDGREPVLTSRVTAAFRATHEQPGRTDLVLIHVEGVDRFRDGWAGHRLVERLVRSGDAEVLAWVAADDLDGHALAEWLGARVVVGAPGRLPATAHGRAGEPVSAWFRRRHHAPWQDWMVEASAALASAADRATQAEHCRTAWGFDKPQAAHRRLRHLRAILCEETREHPGLEQRLAVELLRAVASHGPIDAEPIIVRSVHVAARTLRAHPELGAAIGLSAQEVDDVIAVADAEAALVERVSNGSGRPSADAWRLRREQAVGRVASARNADKAKSEADRARILEHLERSLLTVHDAIEDGGA